MVNVNLECGQLSDFFDRNTLIEARDIMRRFQCQDDPDNAYHGVDRHHLGYLWFKKIILSPINNYFATDSKLIFAMLLDCVKPFDIHHDIKPLPDPLGKHWRSFLIPISVDNDPALSHNASTLIFDQSFTTIGEMYQAPDILKNIYDIYHEKISHVDIEKLNQFSLRQELIWTTGNLLWWDSKLYHTSNNFPARGFLSKQAIVLHTYVL